MCFISESIKLDNLLLQHIFKCNFLKGSITLPCDACYTIMCLTVYVVPSFIWQSHVTWLVYITIDFYYNHNNPSFLADLNWFCFWLFFFFHGGQWTNIDFSGANLIYIYRSLIPLCGNKCYYNKFCYHFIWPQEPFVDHSKYFPLLTSLPNFWSNRCT